MFSIRLRPKAEPQQTEHLIVEGVFTECLTPDRVVLHFGADESFRKLLGLSVRYGWTLYRYAEDNHVGLYVNEDEIYMVQSL